MNDKEMIKKPIGIRILRGILIGLGLLLLNLIFILGPYIGIWGVIIGAVASGFAFIVSGMALVAAYFIRMPFIITLPVILIEYPPLMLLTGGFLFGAGGVLSSLIIWLTRYLLIGTGKYVMWHVNIIRGDDYE